MKKDLRPTYISSSSYAKKQTIPIDASLDPRLNSLTQNFKIARQNAEFVPIGLNANSISLLIDDMVSSTCCFVLFILYYSTNFCFIWILFIKINISS